MVESGGGKKGDLFSPDEWQSFLDDIEGAEAKEVKEPEELVAERAPSKKAKNANRRRLEERSALEIDLHGLTAENAKQTVLRGYEHACKSNPKESIVFLRIVTGKGKRSGPGGSVLAAEIYEYVRIYFENEIMWIDPPPLDAQLGGLPIKGHFDVELLNS